MFKRIIGGVAHLSWLSFLIAVGTLVWRGWGTSSATISGLSAEGFGGVILNTILLVGSSWGLSTAFSLCATYVIWSHRDNWPARMASALLEIGQAVPAIVWGLAGAATFGSVFGISFLSGLLTLTAMLTAVTAPGFIASVRAVDPNLEEQAFSLGLSHRSIYWKCLVPSAGESLITTALLGLGRGLGDAAALAFAAGVAAPTLAFQIFHLFTNVSGGRTMAYRCATLLLVIAMVIQAVVSYVSNKKGQ